MRKVTGYIRIAARFLLAAFIAVFCTFRGTIEEAEALTKAPETFIAGSENTSEEFWTWRKISTQEEMDNLFETYKKYNSDTDVRIPIMLICTIKGVRYMISCSQMVGIDEEAANNYDYNDYYDVLSGNDDPDWSRWNQGRFWEGFTGHYLDRYTKVCFLKVAYACDDYDGLAATAYSDVVVTRSGYSPFYLSSVNVTDQHSRRNITYKYQFFQDAEPDETDQQLIAVAPNAYNEHGLVDFQHTIQQQCIENNLSYNSYDWYRYMNDSWNIECSGNGLFQIYTYYFPPVDNAKWSGALVQQRVGFCMTSDNNSMKWHQGMWAYQKSAGGEYSEPWKGDSSTDKYSNQEKSVNVEDFEIWYGVEGIAKDALDAVNGTKTGSISEEDQEIITPEVVAANKSKKIANGSVYAIPDFTVLYIPKDQKMEIEEGAKVIVGRNAVIVNNGTIINNGELIVQPGAVILFDNTEKLSQENLDTAAMIDRGFAVIEGSGDLIVRDGGKVRQRGLDLTGDVYNSGLMCIEEAYVQPDTLTMNSGVLLLYYNTSRVNFWMYGVDILCGDYDSISDSLLRFIAMNNKLFNLDSANGSSAYLIAASSRTSDTVVKNNAVSDVQWYEAVGTQNDSTVMICK